MATTQKPALPNRAEFINGVVIACVMHADVTGIHSPEEREAFADEIYFQLVDWLEKPDGAE